MVTSVNNQQDVNLMEQLRITENEQWVWQQTADFIKNK